MRILLATVFCFATSLLYTSTALATALPENNLSKYDNVMLMRMDMSEEIYNKTIKDVVDVMKPYVEAHGVTFNVDSNWEDSTVNAYASQYDSTWTVSMFGGLARRSEVTPDGFAFVVCHEVGHHVGGYPFYSGENWAAAEGQADYFATHTCLRQIWAQSFDENKEAARDIDAVAKLQCDTTWTKADDQYLCYRIAKAGMSFANLIYSLEKEYGEQVEVPSFSTPDKSVVSQTVTYHPASQCRLDTVFNGALCGQGFDLTVIPGKSHADGQDSVAAETLAAAFACTKYSGFENGHRPRCWYKSRID